jgi:two-component system, NarL family, response regulator NreC
MKTKATSVLVVANETIPRVALNQLLGRTPAIKVVGESDYARAAQFASRLKANVIIVTIPSPNPDPTGFIRSLHKAAPGSAVIVLGRETKFPVIGRLLRAGALGYVLLSGTPENLFVAIRAASRGLRTIDPELREALFDSLTRSDTAVTELLSQREMQVLRSIVHGHTAKAIASHLSISQKSVETYLARIREKLHLRTRADIIRYAIDKGMFGGTNSRNHEPP